MTEPIFRSNPMLSTLEAKVIAHTTEGGIVCDQSIFYPTGGGQPGDSGTLSSDGQLWDIATTVKGEGDQIVLVPAEPKPLPAVGTVVQQRLDWGRRMSHMRVHTALHLLSVVLPLPVTGGAIGEGKGRLDFLMPEPPSDKQAIEDAVNALIAQDLTVSEEWITEAELDEKPEMVKTMSVQPPRGAGRIRLVRIGEGDGTVDLQPCGGTHVLRTGEIGPIRIGKIENKGKQNRRVNLHLEG